MRKEPLVGLLRLSLAHHPLCWHYRHHTIRFGSIALCLGCTGFYTGMLAGTLIVFFERIDRLEWVELLVVAIALFLPTFFRMANLPAFRTMRRSPRFVYRWLLGISVVIGLISIFKAPNLLFSLGQIVLGVVFLIVINLKRARSYDTWTECQECTFIPSFECPGFSPFHLGSSFSSDFQKHC